MTENNGGYIRNDRQIIDSMMASNPEHLEWLGGKSRAEQLVILNRVRFLVSVVKGVGPKAALEFLYALEIYLKHSKNGKRTVHLYRVHKR